MPFYPPQMTAPPNPLPEWMQALAQRSRDWSEGGHLPGLAMKAVAAMMPDMASKWAGGEYQAGQPIPPGDWMADAVSALSPGSLAMARLKKLRGAAGTVIDAFDEQTGQKVGTLGYRTDLPTFRSIWSKDPDATKQMMTAMQEDLGPRMNEMRIGTEIMPQAIPFWERQAQRWSGDYPDLTQRLLESINMTRDKW